MKKSFFSLLTSLIWIITPANATTDKNAIKTENFTQNQVSQIQQIVHNYIVNNPTVLIEAGKKYQEQETAKEKAKFEEIKTKAEKYKQEIFNTQLPGRIVFGNPNGKLIVTVFTQYHCPHCLMVAPLIDKLPKETPDVQCIIIYWPFFGNDAIYAVKAALAVQKQNKFNELNQALNSVHEFMTKDKIDTVIKSIPGLDIQKLQTDMNTKEIENGIKANFKLAQNLGLTGTPIFILTNKEMTKFSFIPGQTRDIENDLKQSLNAVR